MITNIPNNATTQGCCPTCNRCPTCGRGNYIYPWYTPYYHYPWYSPYPYTYNNVEAAFQGQNPFITYETGGVTSNICDAQAYYAGMNQGLNQTQIIN